MHRAAPLSRGCGPRHLPHNRSSSRSCRRHGPLYCSSPGGLPPSGEGSDSNELSPPQVSDAGLDASSSTISFPEALLLLGLTEKDASSFDIILKKKNKKLASSSSESEKKQIEQAYDVLLMRSLSMRQSGENVDTTVRFADVRGAPKPPRLGTKDGAPFKLPDITKISAPSDLTFSGSLVPSVVFAVLVGWAVLQASSTGPMDVDAPLLQVGIALGMSTYILRSERRLSLPASLGVSVGGLAVGATLGGVAQSWLRVDLAPLGPVHSPASLVALCALLGIWATSSFVVRR
ncbi:POR1 chaperone-like protein [Pseudoscourfieldia marina]